MPRIFPIAFCVLSALVSVGCSPMPLIQDATAVRDGRLKVGIGLHMGMPTDPETYFEPDGPGARGPMADDLQFMPLFHPVGWTRYGVGNGLEVTTAFHVPSFAIALGVKWAMIDYEPGDIFTMAFSGDIGGTIVYPSFIVGGSGIMSFHLTEEVSLDLASRYGTMAGLWNGPTLTSTLGVSIGRKSTVRLAAGYTMSFGQTLGPGFPPGEPAIFLGGGWEYF